MQASREFHERCLRLATNPPYGRAFQKHSLFAIEAVPGGEIGWLFAGHVQDIPVH
jgi:hypothetical protein